MKKLRVLLFNHNIEWRGTFQRCYDFAKLLTRRGHEVTIVTNSPKARLSFESYTLNKIRIVRTPDLFWGILRSGWDPVNVLRRYFYFRKEHFDIIHAFDNRPTVILPALWLSRKWKCPLVSDWCDWWGRGGAIQLRKNKLLNALFEPIETYFEEHYRKYASFLTVISAALGERAIGLSFPKEKIEIFPPIADTDEIIPEDKERARLRLGLEQYSHILIFSGFVLYDLAMVLESFREVHEQFPKCLLILTGGVMPEMLKPYGDLPIRNAGFISQDELKNYLAASDLCLLPMSDCLTNRARYPHKVATYLASGRPVASNLVGDAGRLIEKEGAGIVTEPSPSGFAQGICRLLGDPEELAEMGRNARRVAETCLSGSLFEERLEKIYFSCLNR